MQTDQLIATLAADQRPLPHPSRRLAIAVLIGMCAALAGLMLVRGMPLQELGTTGVAAFAMKLGYTVAIAAAALAAALAAGRPGDKPAPKAALVGLPILILAFAAALEFATTPALAMNGMMPQRAHAGCVAAVAFASVPIFLGLAWAFRPLAPTSPSLAGFLIGLSAGAAAAVIYAFFCPQQAATFLLTAYTAAMLMPAAIGALAGPKLLHW